MRVVVAREPGAAEQLHIVDRPTPDVGARDVLIEVVGAGVNRADILQRQGHYPPPPGASDVLGLEVSGTVAEVGSNVSRYAVGDEVVALLPGGGYAEYVAVDARAVLPAPTGMPLLEAAALPEVVATAWSNLFLTAGLEPDETVLIHGGASGVGSMAIQLAKSAGARVVTTVGSSEKAEFVRGLGADAVINYRTSDFVHESLQFTGGLGCDVVLDIIGAAYLEQNLSVVAPDGRIVVIGLQGGRKATIDLGTLLAKRVALIGTSLRSRPIEDKQLILEQVQAVVWPLIGAGGVRASVDLVVDLSEASKAHQALEEGLVKGKAVLAVKPD